MTPFVSRLLVAAVGLPVVLGLVWLGGWWLFGLALVVGLLALHELYTMARALRPVVIGGYVGLALGLLGTQLGGVSWLFAGILSTLAVSFLVFGFADARPSATAAMGTTVLGVVWVGGGLGCLLLVRDIPRDGRLAIFTVLIAVFAADSAAYLVGRAVGRRKLAPTISPGKSVEGFLAGSLAAVAVAFFALYEQHYLETWESIVLGAAVALAAAAGDLFESAIKRDLGAKDSGRLLAGHGGMLDRLDAPLWAAPAAYLVLLSVS